jgi:hypothetical protein
MKYVIYFKNQFSNSEKVNAYTLNEQDFKKIYEAYPLYRKLFKYTKGKCKDIHDLVVLLAGQSWLRNSIVGRLNKKNFIKPGDLWIYNKFTDEQIDKVWDLVFKFIYRQCEGDNYPIDCTLVYKKVS